MRQHPGEQHQRRYEQYARQERHPELGYTDLQQGRTDGLDDSIGDDEARTQPCGQSLGVTAAFQEPQHQTEDHAQRYAVDKQPNKIPRGQCQREQEQRHLRHGDQHEQQNSSAARADLGDNLDAQKLGQRVAKHLGRHQHRLEPHSPQSHVAKGCGGERLAKGVHAEVGAEGGHHAPRRDGQRPLAPVGRICVRHPTGFSHGAPVSASRLDGRVPEPER